MAQANLNEPDCGATRQNGETNLPKIGKHMLILAKPRPEPDNAIELGVGEKLLLLGGAIAFGFCTLVIGLS